MNTEELLKGEMSQCLASLTESVVLSFILEFDTRNKSTNASYCRPRMNGGWSEP